MATGDRVYLADKPTLDSVLTRVNNIGQMHGTKITRKLALPYWFIRGSAVVYNDEIHIFGGSSSNSLDHYAFRNNQWVRVSTTPMTNPSAIVYNNEIHILGPTAHYAYRDNSWVKVSDTPINVNNNAALVVYQGGIHVLGGYSDTSHYRWDGSSWTAMANIPSNTSQARAVVLDDKIHLIYSNTYRTWDGTSWDVGLQLPYSIALHPIVVYNGEIHVIGGNTAQYSDAHVKLTKDGAWNIVSRTAISDVSSTSAVVWKGRIHLLGGNVASTGSNHYTFSDSDSSWSDSIDIGEKYYLTSGTKIVCDKDKTKASGDVNRETFGYTVTRSGIVTITYDDEDGKCFNIV